jgi:hypothetical protein
LWRQTWHFRVCNVPFRFAWILGTLLAIRSKSPLGTVIHIFARMVCDVVRKIHLFRAAGPCGAFNNCPLGYATFIVSGRRVPYLSKYTVTRSPLDTVVLHVTKVLEQRDHGARLVLSYARFGAATSARTTLSTSRFSITPLLPISVLGLDGRLR